MTRRRRKQKHICNKQQQVQKHWHIAIALTLLFLVLALYTSGEFSRFFGKSSELLAAAMVYWRFFGCLE